MNCSGKSLIFSAYGLGVIAVFLINVAVAGLDTFGKEDTLSRIFRSVGKAMLGMPLTGSIRGRN